MSAAASAFLSLDKRQIPHNHSLSYVTSILKIIFTIKTFHLAHKIQVINYHPVGLWQNLGWTYLSVAQENFEQWFDSDRKTKLVGADRVERRTPAKRRVLKEEEGKG